MGYQMTNYMEICVKNTMEALLEKYDMCKCARCRADIMAIALNNLPAKYIVSPEGELFVKLTALQNQFDVDIMTEVLKAIEIVKNNTRH